MTNKKLCPLKKLSGGAFDYCQKERCAWYDDLEQRCTIISIEHNLDLIRAKLHQIWERLEK